MSEEITPYQKSLNAKIDALRTTQTPDTARSEELNKLVVERDRVTNILERLARLEAILLK